MSMSGVNFNKPRKGQLIGINNAPMDLPPSPIDEYLRPKPPRDPIFGVLDMPVTPGMPSFPGLNSAVSDFLNTRGPGPNRNQHQQSDQYLAPNQRDPIFGALDAPFNGPAFPGLEDNIQQGFSNWLQMEPFGAFKDAYGAAKDFYGKNIYPYTPGARFDPDVERPDSWLTNPFGGGDLLSRSMDNYLTALKANFNQGPDGGNVGSGSSAGEAAVGQNPPATMAVPEDNFVDYWQKAQDYLNANAPDYSGVQDRWIDEGNLTNARIQAMYDQIAAGAGENVQRIGDIYSGASEGIGSAYDTATANTEQAYASAQQQAADQMARLGIEAAAPAVLNPAALSQAEAVANLESGRASGLGATERYGASSGDFASQMAQVAQQEGAQYQTAVADELRRQMINLDTRAQQEAYDRALQVPSIAQGMYQTDQFGRPQEPGMDQDFELKRDQANVDNYYRLYNDLYQNSPSTSPEELHSAVRDYIITGAMGEDARQWVQENGQSVQDAAAGQGTSPAFQQPVAQGSVWGAITNPLQYLW
jgi:hypothetical protein